MCESEEFKGVVHLASLIDCHQDLCDTFAAREQPDYVNVRDCFLSRATENQKPKKEIRHSLCLIGKYKNQRNVHGAGQEVSNSTIILLENVINSEGKKKRKKKATIPCQPPPRHLLSLLPPISHLNQ